MLAMYPEGVVHMHCVCGRTCDASMRHLWLVVLLCVISPNKDFEVLWSLHTEDILWILMYLSVCVYVCIHSVMFFFLCSKSEDELEAFSQL